MQILCHVKLVCNVYRFFVSMLPYSGCKTKAKKLIPNLSTVYSEFFKCFTCKLRM